MKKKKGRERERERERERGRKIVYKFYIPEIRRSTFEYIPSTF